MIQFVQQLKKLVIPAQAGIRQSVNSCEAGHNQSLIINSLYSRLRGNDGELE